MLDLNFHHLRYFWVTAREGGLTKASRKLRVSPSTISTQIKALEGHLGRVLFERTGQGLRLTADGAEVLKYADDIFGLGQELADATRAEPTVRHPLRLRVGVAELLPRLVAYQLLAPAIHGDIPVHLVCRGASPEQLVADLALHHVDLVLSDEPAGIGREVQMNNRLLGESTVTLFGAPALAERLREGFPDSLSGAPILLPDIQTGQRSRLDRWFVENQIRPRVVGEFTDSALLKAFGEEGAGIFPSPTVVRRRVEETYCVVSLGELTSVRERFYAITLQGRSTHPAVDRIFKGADALLLHP